MSGAAATLESQIMEWNPLLIQRAGDYDGSAELTPHLAGATDGLDPLSNRMPDRSVRPRFSGSVYELST